MPSILVPGRLPWRPLAAVAALACAVTLLAVPSAGAAAVDAPVDDAVESDPQVRDARAELEVLRAREAELTVRLDAAAGAYERALAHRLRLEEEVDDTAGTVDTAHRHALAAHESFARSVQAVYRRPDVDLALAEAVVQAPDASTAMHRVALLRQIAVRERLRVDGLQAVVERSTHERRQHQVVAAGAGGAADDAERRADELSRAVSAATQQVGDARDQLADAEAAAAARIREERRRRAAEERARRIAAAGSGPLPPVDGKVCPIGAPNGFIDSWGFPRSGGRSHKGVDMFADYGTPLFAVADGRVRRVWNNRLGGLSIDLLDDNGDRYYYAHLSAVAVSSGQRVIAGQVIGANGNSGNARGTPPHLHWQFHPGGGPPVNPFPLARALCRG